MNFQEQLEKINEENCSILDNDLRIYYILKHIVYDEPETRELFILGELMLKISENIRKSAKGIDDILFGLLKDT